MISVSYYVGEYKYRIRYSIINDTWGQTCVSQIVNWQSAPRWIGSDRENYECLMCTNDRFCRNHPGTQSRAVRRSLLEHSQHISHMQGLKTTRLGFPPSFRWKWTSLRGNNAIFNSPSRYDTASCNVPSQWTVGLFNCRQPTALP